MDNYIENKMNVFSENFTPLWVDMLEELDELYNFPKNGNFLDIGCGYGILTNMFKQNYKYSELIGISPEKDIIEFIDSYYNDISFFPYKIEELTQYKEHFNFIFSRGSYRFWDNKLIGFKNVINSLKKDGIALIGGGFGNNVQKSRIKQARINIANALGKNNGKEGSVPYPTREELVLILKKAGIENFTFTPDDYTGLWIYIKK
ncbi:MAG: class I SAM-dependent methyltransferase [Candidatus Muirbacterium halophilum]|nr:class I SAM-dependent methyltransferase [Candidatus Muirbacterium halophilum]MCK9474542.1 class I SAM-dependent methyltransferase [Candidatus Muirbacterium halophilum]